MLCSRCKTERPTKEFKRHATLAQTRSWLKKPTATKRMVYVGSICNACHKESRRKPSELSPAELRAHLINEDLPKHFVDSVLERRRKAGKAKLRASTLRSLKEQRKHLFEPVVKELNGLVTTLKARLAYERKTTHDAHAKHFLATSLAQVLIAREKVQAKRKMSGTPPDHWQKLISTAEHEARAQAYENLDGKHKDRFAKLHDTLKV